MNILGLSAFYHDSAACLLRDGVIVAAAQEERFTRKRHDAAFPAQALAYCLKEGGITTAQLDAVVFYEKPLLKFDRILTTFLACAPRGFSAFRAAMPMWLKSKLWMRGMIRDGLPGYEGKVFFVEHHLAHAASAFFASPFPEAAVLTMDGVGEWATASVGRGAGNRLDLLEELRFPHSLGMLYSAFTHYAGFKVNSGEYKLMGLAPYGEPRYVDTILRELVDLKSDGSFRLNMRYFGFIDGLTTTNPAFHALFGGPPRAPESRLSQRDADLARSAQAACEEIMLRMARHAVEAAGSRALCLAGGVALNCVGNARLLREKACDRLWVQPAAGDAGGALGSALYYWHQHLGKERRADGRADLMRGALLGPESSDEEIAAFLKARNIPHERLAPAALAERVAALVDEGKVVGLFQGRMEFGPRALGARSIIGDARRPGMRAEMNLKIKFRESFRPFAPAVLASEAARWFDVQAESPYMLLTAPVRAARGADLPSVTHADGSARLQTVDAASAPGLAAILEALRRRTGCPVVVNTSFNVRGEPIVCRPEEAYACFMRTDIDALALGGFLLEKGAQPALAKDDSWKKEFALD
jgi:carbamoyltransferase